MSLCSDLQEAKGPPHYQPQLLEDCALCCILSLLARIGPWPCFCILSVFLLPMQSCFVTPATLLSYQHADHSATAPSLHHRHPNHASSPVSIFLFTKTYTQSPTSSPSPDSFPPPQSAISSSHRSTHSPYPYSPTLAS